MIRAIANRRPGIITTRSLRAHFYVTLFFIKDTVTFYEPQTTEKPSASGPHGKPVRNSPPTDLSHPD
jgi:hypothetical protein